MSDNQDAEWCRGPSNGGHVLPEVRLFPATRFPQGAEAVGAVGRSIRYLSVRCGPAVMSK